MQYWTGTKITSLKENEVFCYGSNPQGINGAGAAKAAMSLSKGAKNGIGRGFNGSNAYALVTKSLNANFLEKSTGILYDKEGFRSVSQEQIRQNIAELYEVARKPENQGKKFLISYQYETWPNGTPKKSLNGYTSQEMLEMFAKDKEIPPNIIFHESYKPHLQKIISSQATMQKANSTENRNDYETDEYEFFFSLHSAFSNCHPSLISYKNLQFISNEQFIKYAKAKTFKDEETAQKILDVNNHPLARDFIDKKITSGEIIKNSQLSQQWNDLMKNTKSLGRAVRDYDDAIWSNKRQSVVRFGARLKFMQNEDLKNDLLNTNNKLLGETSGFDKLLNIKHILKELKEELFLENKKDGKIKISN